MTENQVEGNLAVAEKAETETFLQGFKRGYKQGRKAMQPVEDVATKMENVVARIGYPIVAGIWLSLFCGIMGILECVLVVTIPFGIQWFKIVNLAFWPFNKEVLKKENPGGAALCGNILWFIFNGGILVILFILFWAAMLFTSADKQLDKVFAYAFWPFGKGVGIKKA